MRHNLARSTIEPSGAAAYAGAQLMQMAAGEEASPPLTPAQIDHLVKNGFLARRPDGVELTRKGIDHAEDVAAEIEWIEARGGRA